MLLIDFRDNRMIKHCNIFLLLLFTIGCSGMKPADIGLKNGKLADCPSSPNCISTQTKDDSHRADPLSYKTDLFSAKEKLKGIIKGLSRTKITTEEENYLHVEFTSFLFRFVDDVEFLFEDKNKIIHFRSASRKGHSDFGVNRKRMEKIRVEFNK